ncbi:hypothetical protein GCM10023215_23190 [Pseudonocardia yuanmonensis]|uniref:Uncharacterized protein n=1 Tax=Pseudonocardia yuanmonensis TaxID=1095914 RepID=A0ABP8WCV8_9PSEU
MLSGGCLRRSDPRDARPRNTGPESTFHGAFLYRLYRRILLFRTPIHSAPGKHPDTRRAMLPARVEPGPGQESGEQKG